MKSKTLKNFILLVVISISVTLTAFAQSSALNVTEQASLVTEFDVNGLKVLVKKRPNSPTAAVGLFIRGGTRNINADNSGIENFMLEVSTEASKQYPRNVLRRELSSTGSSIGASSDNDYSILSLASTLKNFNRSWKFFSDIVRNPSFDKADIERIKTRAISGLKEQETDNDNFLEVLQNRIIYENHPYYNDVSGRIETIKNFTAKDLRAFHKKTMQTSKLLLVVVGDIDAAKVKAMVANTIGKLPRGNYVDKPYPKLNFSESTLNVTPRPSLPTNYIKGIFDAPSFASTDYYPMRVATSILNSRLFQEVRQKRQLSYAPSASLDSLSANTANIYVTAVDANQTISVMLNLIKSMKNNPIRQAEIDGMAGQFLTNYYMKQETNAAQALELAKYELIGGGWRNSFKLLNRLKQVTSLDVQNVAKKYMKNIRFVVIGNPQAIEKNIFLQKTD